MLKLTTSMYSNNSQSAPTSEEYLDQIAPKMPKKTITWHQKLITIGFIGIIAIIGIMIVAGLSTSSTDLHQRLAARLLSTKVISDDATLKIKSTELRTYNGNLRIYLTNTIRDITPILAKEGIKIAKLDKKITIAESNTTVLATLEDARLNAIYDRTYAREMSYKLDTLLILMRQINGTSNNKTLKTYLQDARHNLELLQIKFADFNEANS